MNLEELVNTLIAVEQQQNTSSSLTTASATSSSLTTASATSSSLTTASATSSSLTTASASSSSLTTASASSSSLTTASTVSLLLGNYNLNHAPKKTVDELWREFYQPANEGNTQKQLTLGETTLQDFLVNTGAVIVGSQGVAGAADLQQLTETIMDPAIQQQEDWLTYQFTASQQQQQLLPQPMALFGSGVPFFGNATARMEFTDSNQMGLPLMSVAPLEMVRPTSSDSVVTVTTEEKRTDEMMDKSIERRQKRMIKNRESAARSRARKQAYINKLEGEVRQLNRATKRLKKVRVGLSSTHLLSDMAGARDCPPLSPSIPI